MKSNLCASRKIGKSFPSSGGRIICFICIGKLQSNKALSEIFSNYSRMIGWRIEVVELEVKKKLAPLELKLAEAGLILAKIKSNSINIILEEAGKECSSPEFANFIQKLISSGKDINFIIGGAYGFHNLLKAKADHILSLSQLTFPHLLTRVLLIEQLYRAQTILMGHPYHK